jgi:signal transduction histidine kinase
MRYPPFIAVVAAEGNRPKLVLSVWSGYFLAAAFGLLALLANIEGLLPWSFSFYALVAAKLASNTLALLSLRTRRLLLEANGLNLIADLFVMTGAIYFTGGVLSPLLTIYVIEIAVVALVTNLGITLLTSAAAILLYSSMVLAVQAGWLPRWPPPVAWSHGVTTGYLVTGLLYAAFVLGVPTFFTSAILRLLRQKERALQARTDELIEAGRQKSQFMANITHELRTPIHGILGLSQLVSEGIYGPVTDKQQDAMLGVRRSAKGLLQLIDDLLQLAGTDAGKLELKLSRVDLPELLENVVSSVRWMKGTKPLELSLQAEADLPEIETDRAKLVQVMLNLVSNAVKFTPEQGRVVVRASRTPERWVELSVEDNGVGIAPEELPHIFDEFRQVDGSTSREYGGVGLGLALARRLVELMGGRITVESQPGAGSTFTVRLPLGV